MRMRGEIEWEYESEELDCIGGKKEKKERDCMHGGDVASHGEGGNE